MKKKYRNNPKAAEDRIYLLSRNIIQMREEIAELAEVLREHKDSFEWTIGGLNLDGKSDTATIRMFNDSVSPLEF